MKGRGPPGATYRLQFNRDFQFTDAGAIVPYLQLLGISHVYASPFLKARAGSSHGYDTVDHNALNPEIGDESDFAAYVEILRQHGMGQILDIVPNHIGVGGTENAWWLEVLENGEASAHATYFDIDWHPVNPILHNKVLLPFLGDHYGTVLEKGELKLGFDADTGSFSVHYYEHLFPIDPRTYPQILGLNLDTRAQTPGHNNEAYAALASLIASCRALPRRTELSAAHRQRRQQGTAACKQRLAQICRDYPQLVGLLEGNVAYFNGTPGRRKSFDPLHRLLEAQAYRLAYWQVASDEINYRRFFDINDLAGIRVEKAEVFEATHRLIRQLIATGHVDGLRIDHPDGLSDPYGYCCDLQALMNDAPAGEQNRFLWVEKILASYERLRSDWPVAGTTGYETAHLLNGLFVYPPAERPLSRLYNRFTGRDTNFDELLYQCKKLIIHRVLSSELTVLASLLSGIAQSDRRTRDFTYQGLRDALSEVVACFPVYRTYVTAERIVEEDRRYVQWAIAQAMKRNPTAGVRIFDFIHRLLVLEQLKQYGAHQRRRVIQFALRFQQYTAPVMAKGLEDTSFYIDNRLVSLNDVGFDPRSFGISPAAFHHENKQRQSDWPQAMVSTSTHDSKRGEDVRARINVLSEVVDEWRHHLGRWGRINRSKKLLVNDARAPSRNDEYLLYQTLIGSWPLEPLDDEGLADFRARIEAYMLKAVKEAKLHTSWIHPNEEYEAAVSHFVHAILDDPEHSPFLADFLPFQTGIVHYGLYNGLSQTLLKLTVPGTPDIYQGNELWAFNLVDPDNRRAVNYEQNLNTLQALIGRYDSGADLKELIQELWQGIEDGRAKLYLTWKTLLLRRNHPELFNEGDYLALACEGPRAEHLCAFARLHGEQEVIVVATRWFARLLADEHALPIGGELWAETLIDAPTNGEARRYLEVFSNERHTPIQHGERMVFDAAKLLAAFPLALLINE